ncbi:CDP-glycerol glycerophosphotransferase family protein [Candidatus Leptofilum sp.]|uniref:CDP-glycerol glycerophosphotransferase family protein n=1 Tax=Candidatus Leptofilum sp. TaxID=3241576 RepID=UPI003B5C5C87
MRPSLSFWQQLSLLWREIKEVFRFWRTPPEQKQIVFYAAQAQYISYFEGILNQLAAKGAAVCYLTADFDDPILTTTKQGLLPFYLNHTYPFVAPFIKTKVMVYTMPDLNLFHIRRSIFNPHHVFIFHSLCSAHMGLRANALAHFDAVFCNGPYHVDEIRKLEAIYEQKPKTLVEVGYYRLEKIAKAHQEHRASKPEKPKPLVLIAPSWQLNNILEACGQELVAALLQGEFEVVFRPHPMTIYKKPELLRELRKQFGNNDNFRLDTKTVSEKYLHEADVMICDWSGVAMEYALGTERPVLFIDLPPKVHNPEFERVGLEPLESSIRQQIGKVIAPEQVGQATAVVQEFLAERKKYEAAITRARAENIFHFGDSPRVSADYILSQL